MQTGYTRWLKLAFLLAFLAVLLLIAAQPAVRSQLADSLRSLSTIDVVAVMALFLAMRLMQAAAFRHAILAVGKTLSFSISMKLVAIKGVFNLSLTGAGVAAQTIDARLNQNIPVKVNLLANVLSSFALVFSLGLLLAVISARNGAGVLILVGLTLMISASAGIAVVMPGRLQNIVHGIFPASILSGLSALRLQIGAPDILALVFFQLIVALLRLLRVLFIAFCIEPGINFGVLAHAVISADVASIVSITPGGLGVRELVISGFGANAGELATFFSAAVIDRAFAIAFNLLHGGVALWQSPRIRQSS